MRPMRLLLALGLAAGWSVAAAGPAYAGSEDCAITFNGVAAERIDSLSSPLELTVDDDLVFAGIDRATTSKATVEIAIGPVVVDSASTSYGPPSEAFTAAIDLADIAPYGVGLMRVTASTDGCRTGVWLRVTGRFPLTTLTGIAGAGLAVGGVTGQLGAIASRRRRSRTAAALGGIATGSGAALLGQQLGRLELSALSVSLAVVVAAGLGVALAAVLDSAPRGRDDPAEESPATGQEPGVGERTVSAAPYWCYVLADVEVLDLDDHTRIVGSLRPGTWYLARREVGPWLHISTGNGVEGWVPRESAHRQG